MTHFLSLTVGSAQGAQKLKCLIVRTSPVIVHFSHHLLGSCWPICLFFQTVIFFKKEASLWPHGKPQGWTHRNTVSKTGFLLLDSPGSPSTCAHWAPPLGEEYPAGCRWLPQATVSTHPAIAPPVRTVPRQPSAVPVDSVVLSPREGVQLAPPSTSAKDMGSGDGGPWGFQTKDRLQLTTFCPGQSEIRLPLPWAEWGFPLETWC